MTEQIYHRLLVRLIDAGLGQRWTTPRWRAMWLRFHLFAFARGYGRRIKS